MAAPPSLATLALPLPFFLRKLQRKNSWGKAETPLEQRIEEVVRTVFLCEPQPPYSLFQATSDEDLRCVTMGINSGRGSLSEEVNYIPILPNELGAVGIQPRQTEGDTRCPLANRLHFDIDADADTLRALCRGMLQASREVLSLRSKQLAEWVTRTRAEGCLAEKTSTACTVPACVQLAAAS